MNGIFLTRRDSIPEAERCRLCDGHGEYLTDKYDPADRSRWTVNQTCGDCGGTGKKPTQTGADDVRNS